MDEKETGRVKAFSDGVFAVAITLLVLNIQVPPHVLLVDNEVLSILGNQWPIFLAFVTSFATIGIMWLNHHRIFTHIKRTDNTLLILNLLLLLVIVFIPFPTALLAQYLAQYAIHPNEHVAIAVYNGTFLLMAVFFNLIWRYAAYNNRLLDKRADPEAVRAISKQFRFGPLLYMILFGLGWINVPASIAMSCCWQCFSPSQAERLALCLKSNLQL
ncbi:MAG: TMEM175 family protein [Ktedonobacteraceae bacterium]